MAAAGVWVKRPVAKLMQATCHGLVLRNNPIERVPCIVDETGAQPIQDQTRDGRNVRAAKHPK